MSTPTDHPHRFDTLVVGQGLAGSMLAWALRREGQRVALVEQAAAGGATASRTAAGLVNPVTGRRLVKTRGVEVLLPVARRFYAALGEALERPLFHERPMHRLFRDADDVAQWVRRQQDPDYQPWLGALEPAASPGAPFGLGHQRETGYLSTEALLDGVADLFAAEGVLFRGRVDRTNLTVTGEGVQWHQLRATRLVFCEGWRGQHNPWFDWLPFQPAKGEILTLQSPDPLPEAILNGGHWLLPLGNGRCKVGATCGWDPIDETPTTTARDALLAALPQLLGCAPTVRLLEQRAGVRAGTRDRQPFVGFHPTQRALGIFNGFGAKASLLIPWHAERLAAHLCAGVPLPADADIMRFQPCATA